MRRDTIWKFPLVGSQFTEVTLTTPSGFDPLHVAMQNHKITLWARVRPESKPVQRTFKIYGTGWEMDDESHGRTYLGTVEDAGGRVWHVFQMPLEAPQ